MKLYTEEQLREAFFEGVNYAKSITPASMGFIEQYVAKKLNLITPIELPSDEEVEDEAEFLFPTVNIVSNPTYIAHKSFIEGTKWMKEQILNQNK